MMKAVVRWSFVSIGAVVVAACGGGGGSSGGGGAIGGTTGSFTVGGSVTGLNGTGLVLQNGNGNDLPIAADGAFTFPTQVATGATYNVTVKTQPTATPAQTCSVANGSGTMGNAAVSTIAVTCTSPAAKFLIVPNVTSNTIGVFSINGSTGALTSVAGSPFAAGHAAPSLGAFDPAGKFLIVTGRGATNEPPRASVHSINATTGALTVIVGSPFDLSHNPPPPNGATVATYRPLIHPSGAFGYTATIPGDRIYGATLDAASGALTEITGFPTTFGGGVGVGLLIFNASGSRLYAPHVQGSTLATPGQVSVFQVNPPSGTLTPLGTYPTGGLTPSVPALSPDGKVLVVANASSGNVASYLVDATAGTLTPAAGSPFSTGAPSNIVTNVSWHPTRPFVYVTNTNDDPTPSSIAAYSVNATSGVLTPIGTTVTTTGGTGAQVGAVDRTGRFFYASNRGSNSIAAYTIDQTTGALTAVAGSPFATQAQPVGVTFDPSGKYLYAANNGAASVSAYAINGTTGALTLVNTAATGAGPSFAITYGLQ